MMQDTSCSVPKNSTMMTNRLTTELVSNHLSPYSPHLFIIPAPIIPANSYGPMDDDPLTSLELADLEECRRNIDSGRGTFLPKTLSDEEFLASL
mgnify:CR=1 FL=1|jgi:hypothetical protein